MTYTQENVKNFWEIKHKIKDVAALSGCSYDETIDFMGLRPYIRESLRVLEIGVGLGYVTEGLFRNGLEVTALDISDEALERVKEWCSKIYNVRDIEQLPSDYFDVVLCNNVVQHVPTSDLIPEMSEVIRSLVHQGIFAVEFVSTDGIDDMGVNPLLPEIENGGLCRSVDFMKNLFSELGGECSIFFSKDVDIGIVKGHHVFHVTKEKKVEDI